MTRIIAGAAKGRRLRVPPGNGTRPTSDRVREALFSSLDTLVAPWHGLRVADLYAGSGALGLEALSRGASHVLLVESDQRAAAVVRANVAAVGLPGATVAARTVDVVVRDQATEPYDVVLLDPPYALSGAAVSAVLTALADHAWLAEDAVVVVERDKRSDTFTWPDGLEPGRDRRYGETVLHYAHQSGLATMGE